MWQDVHVMVYIGFGFLYTFLKAHSWTSVVFNWLAAAWAMLTSLLWIGFWTRVWHGDFENNKIELSLRTLVGADFCAASVLIAFGVVLGKVNAF